ncbi:hypothetical protein C8R42DRAFT_32924 [Lentinula raphanica]|nr:hypothetical protein C8R42DRAFT_32924 [Lentinula raphanica]
MKSIMTYPCVHEDCSLWGLSNKFGNLQGLLSSRTHAAYNCWIIGRHRLTVPRFCSASRSVPRNLRSFFPFLHMVWYDVSLSMSSTRVSLLKSSMPRILAGFTQTCEWFRVLDLTVAEPSARSALESEGSSISAMSPSRRHYQLDSASSYIMWRPWIARNGNYATGSLPFPLLMIEPAASIESSSCPTLDSTLTAFLRPGFLFFPPAGKPSPFLPVLLDSPSSIPENLTVFLCCDLPDASNDTSEGLKRAGSGKSSRGMR